MSSAKRFRERSPVELTVVLVSPKEDGNIGAVARVMSNFGAEHLVIVNPRAPLAEEAQRRAMAGSSILKAAVVVPTVAEAVRGMDLVVGSTDLSTGRTESYLRRSMSPQEWGRLFGSVQGRVALLLGPEDNGLDREELRLCEAIVTIPTHPASPTLNLSHAAAVLLYEAFLAMSAHPRIFAPKIPLSSRQKQVYYELLERTLSELHYPAHKRRAHVLLMRRLLGRSAASESEVTMMLGFLRKVLRVTPRKGPQGVTAKARPMPLTEGRPRAPVARERRFKPGNP